MDATSYGKESEYLLSPFTRILEYMTAIQDLVLTFCTTKDTETLDACILCLRGNGEEIRPRNKRAVWTSAGQYSVVQN